MDNSNARTKKKDWIGIYHDPIDMIPCLVEDVILNKACLRYVCTWA